MEKTGIRISKLRDQINVALLCILGFILFNNANAIAQSSERPFKFYIEKGSTLNIEVDTLTKEEFGKETVALKEELPLYNARATNHSLLYSLKHVTQSDSCLYISSEKQKLRICDKNGEGYRSGEMYRFIDEKCGFVIMENGGYEWYTYFLIEVNTNELFQFRDIPVFIDCDYAYSYGNYYTEGQFTLHDLISKRKTNIDFYNWHLSHCFRKDNNFYMEFSSSRSHDRNRYIRLQFE
ncbi:hypothetical protein GCM10009122_52710 [Fulvivirga kasyanovii]|uniref:Uncharacterized protein n=1 Tax=Fulvivirga kasyanovii TaxID=396812 RepID=A0ABW9RLV2_9BACT|nr:hypothetical protein [Fulvivirga kasyanovii]MTI24334.1 hypothetical protein [Fulvivirga kasyanovii]